MIPRLPIFILIQLLCFNVQAATLEQAIAALKLTEVVSFDVFVDHNKIHALVAGKTDKKNQARVGYLVSTNGGKQWHKAVRVADKLELISVRGNDIQLAASGKHIVTLWQNKGEFPGMGAMVSFYSHNGGKTWQVGNNPAVDKQGDQSHIDLIADNKGFFHSVWLADPEENGYQSLRYARSMDKGAHWQASQKLDDSTCSCCWNSLALSNTGTINLLYRDMKPRDMALMQSINHGDSWQRVSTVGEFNWQFDGCPHIGGGLAVAKDNVLISTVWTGLDNKAGLYVLRSTDDGKTWSPPKALGKLASHSDIAARGQHIIAIWDEREPEGSSIFYSRSSDNGLTWSEPQRLSKAGNMATHPRLAVSTNGFLALWTEKSEQQAMHLQTQLLK